MANVYYKILNKNIRANYTENIISGIQRELYASAKVLNEDLFDVTRGLNTKRSGLDVDSLLKYYIINQLLQSMPNQKMTKNVRKNYLRTANKKYRKDPYKDEYYIWSEDKWILAENVVKVNDDGSYYMDEHKKNSLYVTRKLFSKEDVLISIQVINPDGKIVCSKAHVVELLNLRQEYVLKYKYSGYSGNSNDIIAGILNKFSNPIETGYYMDNYYNLYKWKEKDKCLIKLDPEDQSPLLIDYDFAQSRKVIKKEYTGIK